MLKKMHRFAKIFWKTLVNITHKSMYRIIINAAFFLSLSIAGGCTNSKDAEIIKDLTQKLEASKKECKKLRKVKKENPPKARVLFM